ncbi:MAG: transglutaminase domain-containing protein [Dehalococcoidia bacterium]|nr:MAG: transglutaminase domain-containing protein [Dehalococcoidia bacterium]
MKRIGILISLAFILLGGLAGAGYAWASSSEGFYEIDGELYDDWAICRTRSFGEDGFYQLTATDFRPVIAFESLGENADIAYSLGQEFAAEYPDTVRRAEAVFYFVRDRVRYTSDIDLFGYDEFALNADELAGIISQNERGYGDCEDSAVLLAVICKGAGLRSAIAIGEGHTAALIYLPDYDEATAFFELSGETGWIWAEATGRDNPLGWVPREFLNARVAAYEVTEEALARAEDAPEPEATVAQTDVRGGGGSNFSMAFPFFGVIFFLWFISSLFRRGKRAKK